MRFMRFTAGYTKWDHIRNDAIMKELQVQPVSTKTSELTNEIVHATKGNYRSERERERERQ